MPGTGERDRVPRLGAVAPLDPGDPRRIGRYLLSGRLGAGGMGTVYLGRHEGGGPPVAVKVVHAELAGDPEFRARFADEVAAARRVAPFCTARVLDADPAALPPYLVTEFVDGMPLGTAVADGGPLDSSTLHGVALGVAAALAAVHAAGVVHRDLKPANVLLSLSGPRVIDFGIARALDAARQHTLVGMLVGTPGWMAPEQFRGGAVGPPSDVFSWGSLVAYAATGRNPWGGDGRAPVGGPAGVASPPAALAHRILHGEPDLAGLHGPLRRLVESALAKDPARRPTARELVDELLGGSPAGPGGDPTVAASRLVERTWTGPSTLAAPTPAAPPWSAPPSAGPPGPNQRTGGAGPGWAPAGRGRGPSSADLGGRPAADPTRVLPPRPRNGSRPAPTRVLPPGAPPPAAGPAAYQPYEPPRPRRRWYRRKWVLVPVGLLVLLALLPDDQGDRPVPAGPSEPRPELGRPVRDGELEFVVRDVRCGVRKLGSGPLARDPAGQFCLARVDVTNVKTGPRTLYEPFQKLQDSEGQKHAADFAARFYYRDQTLWDEIGPGESVRGTMVFDIPAGVRPVALELHDTALSGGVTVRLP